MSPAFGAVVWSIVVCQLLVHDVKITYSMRLNRISMPGPRASLLEVINGSFTPNKIQRYQMFMESMDRGAEAVRAECKYQFQWDRWNCPDVDLNHQSITSKGTREIAFVQALLAAGIMHDLIEQCNLGAFACRCGKPTKSLQDTNNDWEWDGCSDNIHLGEMASKSIMDSVITGKDARAVMNLQNYRTGRKSVKKNARIVCKCLGVTGSCSLRTCWQQLGHFRSVGIHLKKRYKRAVYVNYFEGKLKFGNDARGNELKLLGENHLTYIEQSPDYCKRNVKLGINGTLHRMCSRKKKKKFETVSERKSCRRLCRSCGYKVKKRKIRVKTSCNCLFRWCCNVVCSTCVEKRSLYFCSL